MSKDNKVTSFIFMGDPQCSRLGGDSSDYSRWSRLLQRALTEMREGSTVCADSSAARPPLLVLGGDIVNRGSKGRTAEWEAFLEAEEAAGGTDLLMATPVNGSEESTGVYADRFFNPGNGPLFHEKEFFSFDYGCCHFMFLDSAYMGNRQQAAYKYIGAWIRSDLAANRQPVVFAVMHHPAFTLGTSFEDDVRAAAIRENYLKLLYRYGVDFILCGHQHVYARTKPMVAGAGKQDSSARSAAEENDSAGSGSTLAGITQLMGISGTKYFDAWDKSNMDLVSEYTSVATVFETDGEMIRLKTIDEAGTVIDAYSQPVRPPVKRKCGTCENFSRCGGTGKFEKLEAEKKARENGDPLKPANASGLIITVHGAAGNILIGDDSGDRKGVGSVWIREEELNGFEQVEVEYSVMRRGRLEYERFTGFRLDDLLEKAGIAVPAVDAATLILTDRDGRQKILPLHEVLEAWWFGGQETAGNDAPQHAVPPILTKENGGWRIIFGQQNAGQYNGRGWMREIRQIGIDV